MPKVDLAKAYASPHRDGRTAAPAASSAVLQFSSNASTRMPRKETLVGLMERLNAIASELPDDQLAEVVGFAEALRARHDGAAITVPDKAIDVDLMHAVRAQCNSAFAWRRDELYDRGLR